MNATKYLVCLCALAVVFLAGTAAMAQADGVVIHHRWLGNPQVLNIHITGAPANVPIEVIVTQMPEWNQEPPNGDPPNDTDGDGNWPGEDSGDEVGYPGTGGDDPGTEYVVSVIINGETGPSTGITKPSTFWKGVLNFFSLKWFVQRYEPERQKASPILLWLGRLASIEPHRVGLRNYYEKMVCDPSWSSTGRIDSDCRLVGSLPG